MLNSSHLANTDYSPATAVSSQNGREPPHTAHRTPPQFSNVFEAALARSHAALLALWYLRVGNATRRATRLLRGVLAIN